MHVLLELPAPVVEPAVDAAAERGIALMALDRRYFGGPVTTHGIVLGYGGAALAQLITASRTLREILLRLLRRAPG
jgi:DNA-binding transcriptional MocR family regulator